MAVFIDIETGIGAWKSIQHGDVWEEYYQRLFNQGGILNENLACPLQAYLNHILLCERSTQKCQVQEISYGGSLYE